MRCHVEKSGDNLYSIQQAAALTGIPESTVRFYGSHGVLDCEQTPALRIRIGEDEIVLLHYLTALRSAGAAESDLVIVGKEYRQSTPGSNERIAAMHAMLGIVAKTCERILPTFATLSAGLEIEMGRSPFCAALQDELRQTQDETDE